ncbi:MAG: J domain-containing protein [Verrucomicrobiota bacterium]|nr:J domain-containing protein [Verrucomicrobiota bacterium]
MTDYFALLDQPRAPWLDLEKLKEAFHQRTLHAHPDQQSGDNEAFAKLNEGYRVLREPKRRLEHLLALLGEPPLPQTALPKEIEELFPSIAALVREADDVIAKMANAASALSRSLARAAVAPMQARLQGSARTLADLQEESLVRLKALNAADIAELRLHYVRLSYLGRWLAQLEEKQTRLSETMA